MVVREAMKGQSRKTLYGVIGLLVFAGALLAHTFWPEHKANLQQAFFSDDDGKTWFADSIFRVPPFTHDGKTAVGVQVYTYQGGSKRFCGYLTKYTPEAKAQLESAISDAQSKGQAPGTVSLYRDPAFMNRGRLIKTPGDDQPWLSSDDPRVQAVQSIHSPDGSAIDILLP